VAHLDRMYYNRCRCRYSLSVDARKRSTSYCQFVWPKVLKYPIVCFDEKSKEFRDVLAVDEDYPDAERIVLVLDNLNIHTPGACPLRTIQSRGSTSDQQQN